MVKKPFSFLIIFLLATLLMARFSIAGQVVTDDVKVWAKKAIEQEKAIETVGASNTLAILYFHNKTSESTLDLLEKGLAFMLVTDLSKVEGIQLVERVKIQALVEELHLSTTKLVEPGTTSRMGKLLGVQNLVGGDIFKLKMNEFELKSALLDVPANNIFGQPEVEGKLIEELLHMEKDLLFEIIRMLKMKLTSQQTADLQKPLTTNLQALLYLFQAIEYSDRRDYAKAIEFYEKAIAADANIVWAKDGIEEILSLGLLDNRQIEPEAYSIPERFIIPDFRREDRPDERDRLEREKNLEKGKITLSWAFAKEDEAVNASINRSAFLSYAVQSEAVSPRDTFNEKSALSAVNTAISYEDIRLRDEWETRQIDAETGKVLKDRDGNRVRVDQYILRPDANTVQLVNICLREGKGANTGLTTMDWRTTFTQAYVGDLRALPWSGWLDTKSGADGRYVRTTDAAPELKEMSVTFTNPLNEYLQESRGFTGKSLIGDRSGQYIGAESLTLFSGKQNGPVTYQFGEGYQVVPNGRGGFGYVFENGSAPMEVSLFVVSDTDTTEDKGEMAGFKDIWDALRVNESGASQIGNNTLEIVIDHQGSYFSAPVDLIYVPMSRMEWRSL